MNELLTKAKGLTYHSLQYVTPENPGIIIEGDHYVLITEEQGARTKVHWAAHSLENLIEGLNLLSIDLRGKEVKLDFIPPDFVQGLESKGYKVLGEFTDFWIKNLMGCQWTPPQGTDIRQIEDKEAQTAAWVTKSCKGLSRGFDGEDQEAILEWLQEDDHLVFAAFEGEAMVGVCMMATYASGKETVAWLRELAVHPNHQRKGIARALAYAGLEWGKTKGATQSFLAADIENTPAISLYRDLGYEQADGRGEIQVFKNL